MENGSMPACDIDHLVVAAASLPQGVSYIREKLGIEIPPGGKHPLMGTHNHLMRLGPACFLEVIAIDPDAPPPSRRRWYDLDNPQLQQDLQASPRLITWVVRCLDIIAVVDAAAMPLGSVLTVSRGALSWRLTVPDDGHLLEGGVVPPVIEWACGARPWEAMADPGCRLVELTLAHPDPDWLCNGLRSLHQEGYPQVTVVEGTAPGLKAKISTPEKGIVEL
jgi:hypothetical protein